MNPLTKIFSKKQSEQELVDEIHAEFDSAQDRLYQYAMEVINECSSKNFNKAELLNKHGFTSNKLVVDYNLLQTKKNVSEKQAELIQYYKNAYPFLKFITEEELDRICDKYGLVYAPVSNYKMPVPDKNLQDIDDAQSLNSNDVLGGITTYKFVNPYSHQWEDFKAVSDYLGKVEFTLDEILEITKEHCEPHLVSYLSNKPDSFFWALSHYSNKFKTSISTNCEITTVVKSGLFIAAPKPHFNLEGLEHDKKKGFFKVTKTEVKDPIVFRYVKGGVQIITKWGLEAEDPALQHEILN